MDEAARRHWTGQQLACPGCGRTGVPIVLDIVDADTMAAVRTGLACLGECCFDGARGIDHQCLSCGLQWGADQAAVGSD